MEDLRLLRKKIVAKRKVDKDTLDEMRAVMLDGDGMTYEKGDFLFELKKDSSEDKLSKEFESFFIEMMVLLLVEGGEMPGEIGDKETEWLSKHINNSQTDAYDRKLLQELKKESFNFPQKLHFKNQGIELFERTVFGTRYLAIIAVLGSMIAAAVLFVEGGMIVYYGIKTFIKDFNTNVALDYEIMFKEIVSSVDVFLFAMVLVIFGSGVYDLFITKMDPLTEVSDSRRVKTIDDLKRSLGKVILMVLIVSFFKHTLEFEHWEPLSMLYLSVGIILISLALYISHKSEEIKE